jgi:protein involved in polysaccharide export with SLBB domain
MRSPKFIALLGTLLLATSAWSATPDLTVPAYLAQKAASQPAPAPDEKAKVPVIKPPVAQPSVGIQPYGASLFTGAFAEQGFTGFNPEYRISIGDRIVLRMWGGFNFEGALTVDTHGNIFVPNVGPVPVVGIKNEELNKTVLSQISKVYRNNVEVYATLEAAQPVRVFVTGQVRSPGLYPGVSADSVLAFLDRAGGVDPDRGSYVDVRLMRNGEERAKINLYDFLQSGKLTPVQLADGDTLLVTPRRPAVQITGDVFNQNLFEISKGESVPLTEVLAVAHPRPGATDVTITRRTGERRDTEAYALSDIADVKLYSGDEVRVATDRYPGTITVRIEGAHEGSHFMVLPYGSQLGAVLQKVEPSRLTDIDNVTLFRSSVARAQKEMIDISLKNLEATALTAPSVTQQEAQLRAKESEMILNYIDRARLVEPKGQIILDKQSREEFILEDGDRIVIPEQSSLVNVSGEVAFPAAIAWRKGASLDYYIERAGGLSARSSKDAKILVARPSGEIKENATPLPGDRVMVLPVVKTKNVELARGLTQILYEIAIATSVVLGI